MMLKRTRWLKALIQYENRFTWGANVGISFTAILVLYGLAMGVPTLPPTLSWIHLLVIVGGGWLGFHIIVLFISTMLILIRIPLPRLFVSNVLCFASGTIVGWEQANISLYGVFVVATIYLLLGVTMGSSITMLFARKYRIVSNMYGILAGVTAISILIWLYGPGASIYPPKERNVQSEQSQFSLSYNPAARGKYDVAYFTYGSGTDLHRKEFGSEVDLVSNAVDASFFLEDFRKFREIFWRFDPGELPLNARVWMPQGMGPFPLALIVHGNHHMEYFSDDGYAYLGELLASKGIIVVSVDENFINYSNWSGSVDPDMTVRAWLLLQHIDWIAQKTMEPDNHFSGKVDLDHIAFMGHSRGGQAAALAASFDTFFAHSDVFQAPAGGRPYTGSIGSRNCANRSIY